MAKQPVGKGFPAELVLAAPDGTNGDALRAGGHPRRLTLLIWEAIRAYKDLAIERRIEQMPNDSIEPLNDDILADLPIEELEQRLEMQVLKLPEAQGCWDCNCYAVAYTCSGQGC